MLDDPRTYRQFYDVGNDGVLTNSQMIDTVAQILGRHHPIKLKTPWRLLGALAPLIERVGKLLRGAIKGLANSLLGDASGDPMPIRTILPRPLLSYRLAVEHALPRQ